MFGFFETIALAFAIALALYEAVVYVEAFHRSMMLSSKVRTDRKTGKMGLDHTSPPLGIETRFGMALARYRSRSLVFHQWHMWVNAAEPEFKPYSYAFWAAVGTLCFGLSGATTWLAAAGLGIAGALTVFVSKQGRNVLLHSDECSEQDDIEKNLQLRALTHRH